MIDPTILGEIALYSCLGYDGGPRGYRRRGSPIPEKYLPGRFLMSHPHLMRRVIEVVNTPHQPAPWWLRTVIDP